MAALIPIIGAAGAASGTAMTALSTLATVASVAGGVMSVAGGIQQKKQLELQADEAVLAGRQKQIAINKQEAIDYHASQARAGAMGMESSGSIARAQETNRRNAEQQMSIEGYNASSQADQLRSMGSEAAASGLTKLTGSLFDTVGRVQKYKSFKKNYDY